MWEEGLELTREAVLEERNSLTLSGGSSEKRPRKKGGGGKKRGSKISGDRWGRIGKIRIRVTNNKNSGEKGEGKMVKQNPRERVLKSRRERKTWDRENKVGLFVIKKDQKGESWRETAGRRVLVTYRKR